MNGPRECHTERNKAHREGEIWYDMPYIHILKINYTDELIYKTETDSENELMVARVGRVKWRES